MMQTPNSEDIMTAWYGGQKATPQPATYGAWIAPSQQQLAEGTLLAGRYRIGSVLGVGGFATVYAAWDMSLHRWVAVKAYSIYSAGIISTDEAHLQATCQHPNVMPLYDTGSDPLIGVGFLVMPQYPGSDLATTLNRYGQMPFRPALLSVDQICSALDFMWTRRQAIHGDVKPANIWLTQNGSALLMDFNLRGLLVRNASGRGGTPGYTAPEALSGRVSPATDVFSLGCVLYQCLAGVPPFADDEAVLAHRFIPLHQFRPDIRPELETVIHTALSHNPEERYQTPKEFQSALRRPLRQGNFSLYLYHAVLRGAGRVLGWAYHKVWHHLSLFLRHAWRHPIKAGIEALVVLTLARIGASLVAQWVEAHRIYVLLGTLTVIGIILWRVRVKFQCEYRQRLTRMARTSEGGEDATTTFR